MVAPQDPPIAKGDAPTAEAADQLAEFEDAAQHDANGGVDRNVRAEHRALRGAIIISALNPVFFNSARFCGLQCKGCIRYRARGEGSRRSVSRPH